MDRISSLRSGRPVHLRARYHCHWSLTTIDHQTGWCTCLSHQLSNSHPGTFGPWSDRIDRSSTGHGLDWDPFHSSDVWYTWPDMFRSRVSMRWDDHPIRTHRDTSVEPESPRAATIVRYSCVNPRWSGQGRHQRYSGGMPLIESDFLNERSFAISIVGAFSPVVGRSCSLFSRVDRCGSSVKKFKADRMQNCAR